MIGTIKKLKDKLGNYIYPVTHSSAVFVASDETLETRLDKKITAVKVRNSVDQAIANATLITLNFSTVEFDTKTMFSVGTPNRITINEDGLYSIIAGATFTGGSVDGARSLQIISAATYNIAQSFVDAKAGSTTSLFVNTTIKYRVGDFIEIKAIHTNGTGVNIKSSTAYSAFVSVVRLGKVE